MNWLAWVIFIVAFCLLAYEIFSLVYTLVRKRKSKKRDSEQSPDSAGLKKSK